MAKYGRKRPLVQLSVAGLRLKGFCVAFWKYVVAAVWKSPVSCTRASKKATSAWHCDQCSLKSTTWCWLCSRRSSVLAFAGSAAMAGLRAAACALEAPRQEGLGCEE